MQRDLVEAIKQFPQRIYRRGEVILQSGLPADTLFAIRQGYVKVDSLSQRGNIQLVWLAGRYDIVPTELLFSRRGELRFSYSALTELSVYEIPKRTFLEMCDDNPGLVREIAVSMSEHYDDLLTQLRSVEQSSIRDKLVHTLHYIATRFSSETVVRLEALGLQLSHQDLANMVGASRETTAIELKRLKDEHFIDYTRGDFTIHVDRLQPLL